MQNKTRYGLVGKDIAYSFSRSYFAEKFKNEGISSCSYENFDLESIELIKEVLKAKNLGGLNVTIPYKEAIIPYLDELSEDAKIIGAVNTIRFLPNGKAEGHNTDAYGFKAALAKQWGNHAIKALILGPKAGQIGYEQIDSDLMQAHLLIINCTPLGTHPEVNKAPAIPYESISSKHFLFDLIYNPELTLFLKEGKKRGATTQNGLFMLEQQAEKSWNIWNEATD